MPERTLHFVACLDADSGIPVAICLEHDLVTQAETLDGLRAACEELLLAHVVASTEVGVEPWTVEPPPDYAIAEFRSAPGAFEFEIMVAT